MAAELLPAYIAHLRARVKRERRSRMTAEEEAAAALPSGVSELCNHDPNGCLDLITQALGETLTPEEVRAVGTELLENLLNESAGKVADRVSVELKKNKRFRQAFAFGNYASVDPAVLNDWVKVFGDLGTTKAAERKSVYRRGNSE